jgi:glycerate kinase
MRILIAPDKFKGSLTAQEVCDAISEGLLQEFPDVDCISFPLADGGEGTLEILTHHSRGTFVSAKVHDPLFRQIDATYGISSDGNTAFIDIASASGLRLLQPGERNVMKTSTFGTGELIVHAMTQGITEIILGIGGSATNDGAAGAARALGFEFLDRYGKTIEPVGKNLIHVQSIKTDNVNRLLSKVKFTAICDVENPLTGRNGAAYVYGPQKGATADQVKLLDEGLINLSSVIKRDLNTSIENVRGAGAGGGFGGGVVAFLKGGLKKGIDVVFDYTGFEEELKQADVIITGEGKLDRQTLEGKVVAGVARLAQRYRKNVFCVTGRNELDNSDILALGFSKVFSLEEYSPTNTMENTYEILSMLSANILSKEIGEQKN